MIVTVWHSPLTHSLGAGQSVQCAVERQTNPKTKPAKIKVNHFVCFAYFGHCHHQVYRSISLQDNVLSQKGLGDFAGILKCFYTLHTRIALCDAAIGKFPLQADDGPNDGSADTGSTPADFSFDESEQENLKAQIEKDPVMMENAGEAVCLNYLRRTDLFDCCNVRSDFADKLKTIATKASSTKVVAAALRKSVREMDSMIKASHTVGNKQVES